MTAPVKPCNAAVRDTYHHGHLREALVQAALDLIEEQGLEALSVREVARRAGVSPGAPFRHFANRTALLTAVAEQAGQRLHDAVDAALARSSSQPPIDRLAALGAAYLRWARENPLHFRIVSDRALIDYEGSNSLRTQNAAIREHMRALLLAHGSSAMGRDAIEARLLAARALVYGLARMAADGHLAEWSGQSHPDQAQAAALKVLIDAISAQAPETRT